MKAYNGFTASQRSNHQTQLRALIHKGIIERASKCSICGQTKGLIHYHVEDYTLPVRAELLIPLCWKCHMIHHTKGRNPEKAQAYFDRVKIQPDEPVYIHDNSIIRAFYESK